MSYDNASVPDRERVLLIASDSDVSEVATALTKAAIGIRDSVPTVEALEQRFVPLVWVGGRGWHIDTRAQSVLSVTTIPAATADVMSPGVVRMDMESDVKRRVPELTGILTALSLALVFGAVLGIIPQRVLPRAPEPVLSAIPHVNAIISTVAIGTIIGGWYFARHREYRKHRALMLTSLGLFVAFLVLYLYKVSMQGPAEFSGPTDIYQFVYLPLLGVHILLAIICIPLLYYVVLLGLTRPVGELFDTHHRRVGRVAASLWIVSFVLGNTVYALLYLVYT